VTDQLSTIQPRTSFVLCTQIVYHLAPGLSSCRDAQPVHYPVPDFTCVTCSTVHGNLWHFHDPHRNQLTILIMCAMLPRNGCIWNTFTNTVACVFTTHHQEQLRYSTPPQVPAKDPGTMNRRLIDNASPSHPHHHQNYPITSTSHIWPSNPVPSRSSDKLPLSQFTPPFVIHAQSDDHA